MPIAGLPELRGLLADRLVEDPDRLDRVASDASHLTVRPAACARPRDAQEIVEIIRWARRHRVPLVPRGGGTSLDGESVPAPGSVVIDLAGWTRIQEVDPQDRIARVGPGVVNRNLQDAAGRLGLFFPPNPGSWGSSTIGGNASTNASGPRSFKYGPTRNWVRAAEVVLGTGERLSLGSRSAKRSTGPDLLQLMIGSEGTLGVFTEIMVGLAPRPPRRAVAAAQLPPSISLGRVAAGLARGLLGGVSAVEYLDATCATALAGTPGSRIPADRALLLVEVESADEEDESRRLSALAALLQEVGVVDDPIVFPDADALWTLRGASGAALDRTMGPRIREDVGIPLGRIDEFLTWLSTISADAGAVSCVYGHLGEGSLHPNIALAPGTVAGERLRARILQGALDLNGTLSAEHGIGQVKAPAWAAQIGAEGRRVVHGLRQLCDPDGILNPGKVLPDPRGDRAQGSSPSGAAGPRTPPA